MQQKGHLISKVLQVMGTLTESKLSGSLYQTQGPLLMFMILKQGHLTSNTDMMRVQVFKNKYCTYLCLSLFHEGGSGNSHHTILPIELIEYLRPTDSFFVGICGFIIYW